MKRSLRHLPERKRWELDEIVKCIREKISGLQMIILFGSHTGDGWVEDISFDGPTMYEYLSDFDILVIVKTNRIANSTNVWHRLDRSIGAKRFKTPVTIIAHDIDFVNRRLKQANYFFKDIKKEGIVLYDSGESKLERIGRPKGKERAEIAKEDFEHWTKKAKSFLADFGNACIRKDFTQAAFYLHQAAEAFFNCTLLVFTNYKPKSHDLKKLNRMAANLEPEFFKIFPQATKEQKDVFELLNRAYVDARYKKDYKITKDQLEYLADCVRKLQRLTNKSCKKKIEFFFSE